jgi:hypothetical protein
MLLVCFKEFEAALLEHVVWEQADVCVLIQRMGRTGAVLSP